MGLKNFTAVLAFSASMLTAGIASAADLEVTHWWTSGGEAAAVAEFAKAVDASGDKWVDGAIAGSGDVARPIIISRILGGNPMGATQLNPGKDADESDRCWSSRRHHRRCNRWRMGQNFASSFTA